MKTLILKNKYQINATLVANDFIDHYMKSRTRALIDEGQAYVSTMDAESLFDYFLKNDKYFPIYIGAANRWHDENNPLRPAFPHRPSHGRRASFQSGRSRFRRPALKTDTS